ncbi:hypothetical protein E2C01_092606 [Portunus trituberculatus]|uniref:Uncharacterized protein n=1 Tax=Portunus trituberculatus TaxID=210409 RepID=A0A5B7JR01_PORTR|nr:hypothetical protein [Portunus trituberculatus]
MPYSAMQWRGV